MLYHFPSTGLAVIKQQIVTNVCKNVAKSEPLHTADSNVQRSSYFGKQFGSSLNS